MRDIRQGLLQFGKEGVRGPLSGGKLTFKIRLNKNRNRKRNQETLKNTKGFESSDLKFSYLLFSMNKLISSF